MNTQEDARERDQNFAIGEKELESVRCHAVLIALITVVEIHVKALVTISMLPTGIGCEHVLISCN